MTRLLFVLLALAPVAATAQTAPPAAPPTDSVKAKPKSKLKLDGLDWMAGCWAAESGPDELVEENWTKPTDNLMLAVTRYTKKKESTGWEFTRIMVTDSGIVFAAQSNGRPEDVYPMVRQSGELVLFENLKKPFPQRISYRKASDGALIPRNEGEGQQSIEIRLLPVRCPGEKR